MEMSSQIGSTLPMRMSLAARGLLLILTVIPIRAAGQPMPTPPQQAGDQDCEKIKQDIQQLQQDLANLSVEMQRLTQDLDQVNQAAANLQADINNPANAGRFSEAFRGQLLDTLAKTLSVRRQLTQQLEEDANAMQAIKDEIADLLNKLGSCGGPNTTGPPEETPKAQTPQSAPTEQAAPQTAPPTQPGTNEDCEKIKQNVQQLQQDLANLSVEMQRLTQDLDQVNQAAANLQADINNPANAGRFSEAFRGQLLDTLAKTLSVRRQLTQQLEDDANAMQAIKDEIADLLSKLPNCTSPSAAQPTNPPSPPQENKRVSFDFRGFGGATFVAGNTPATAGFDGAVLFPLGNRVLVGPTAGFQWVDSSIVSSIGSMTPGSTFANTTVGFKNGNFGGTIGFPFGGWQLGIQGGATVAGSTITQQSGFCGLGNATSPAGCTVLSTTTTHDTVIGPFVGGYISHSLFSHVGVFAEFDYSRLKDGSVYDVSDRAVVAGIVLSFGRHKAK